MAAGIFEKLQTGVRWFFLPPRTCSSLFNGPVCCPQCPILNFWAVAALFVKHVFCCWGHHILKKSKWWGMPACALQLGWPQTSDEQSGAMRCRAWLPLLGTQWPLWPKVCAASQPHEVSEWPQPRKKFIVGPHMPPQPGPLHCVDCWVGWGHTHDGQNYHWIATF